MDNIQKNIKDNLNRVEEKILRSLDKCGRTRNDVKVLVVSKAQPVEKIIAAYECGVRDFGENYPEETAEKMAQIPGENDIVWHMIGHLQSRKARIVAASFHMLHSLDAIRTAEKLEPLLAEYDRILPVLIEINTGGEESKSGLDYRSGAGEAEIEEFVETLRKFPHIEIKGLMTMPPLWEQPEKARPYFQELRLLMESLKKKFPELSWQELSMGTSGDFETAIEEGATMIRIGQAVLGERNYSNRQ
jgi:pyridoxal phosphate enzyme (YggS family)